MADWAPKFLAAILDGLHVRDASHAAGVDRSQPYVRYKRDEEFRVAWDEAATFGQKALEQEAGRRAYHGTLKPIFHLGRKCGEIREYSDTLLMFLLRAADPAKYRENMKMEIAKEPVNVVYVAEIVDGPTTEPANIGQADAHSNASGQTAPNPA